MDVTVDRLDPSRGGSFLLQLLHFAGWRLQVRDGETVRIRATRGDVEIDVTAATMPAATGTVFARAMRSARPRARHEGR